MERGNVIKATAIESGSKPMKDKAMGKLLGCKLFLTFEFLFPLK